MSTGIVSSGRTGRQLRLRNADNIIPWPTENNIEIEVWCCSIIWTESKNLAVQRSSYYSHL